MEVGGELPGEGRQPPGVRRCEGWLFGTALHGEHGQGAAVRSRNRGGEEALRIGVRGAGRELGAGIAEPAGRALGAGELAGDLAGESRQLARIALHGGAAGRFEEQGGGAPVRRRRGGTHETGGSSRRTEGTRSGAARRSSP